MWRLLGKFISGRAESAEISKLKSDVKGLEQELAQQNDVTIPALRREVELANRVIEMYALRVEQEVVRVEAETGKLTASIASGRAM